MRDLNLQLLDEELCALMDHVSPSENEVWLESEYIQYMQTLTNINACQYLSFTETMQWDFWCCCYNMSALQWPAQCSLQSRPFCSLKHARLCTLLFILSDHKMFCVSWKSLDLCWKRFSVMFQSLKIIQ